MPRVRFGVRPPPVTTQEAAQTVNVNAKSLVLQRFSGADTPALTAGLVKAVALLHTCITGNQLGQRKAKTAQSPPATPLTDTEA
mgnify:CR=1 FL=1